ncbi:hypothetical protein DWX97_21940 [Bacteroides cellulosilyticus]|uniref:Uncharacterized protein n=2 Tax=Bacteroides TaxID=816 RepID=A0A412I935_9BACE|nr:hypothetical protein HMPREF2531_00035 [Bacteroides intestinalis]RGS33371.1 hypothetical protein DWX97_21940 [Bacteroides cellulosilyticus]
MQEFALQVQEVKFGLLLKTFAIFYKMLNRNFIGYEIQEKYIEIAKWRLMQVDLELTFKA